MTLRPTPGPWRIPAPFRPRYVDTAAHEVAYIATCDRGPHDADLAQGQGRRPAHLHVHLPVRGGRRVTRAEEIQPPGYVPIAIPHQVPPVDVYGDFGPGVVIPLPKEAQ